MSARTILCLANSWKEAGRCVAGKEVKDDGFGGWLRPVSARPDKEISDEERRLEGQRPLRLLDIVEIPVRQPAPSGHQTENVVIDDSRRWVRKGGVAWDALTAILDDPPSLWLDGHSTRGGLNDRVRVRDAVQFQYSLALIRPEGLQLEGYSDENRRRRVRARFGYKGREFALPVTDPVVLDFFRRTASRERKMVDTYLCVSLSEEFVDHWCYKLAAAVLSKRPI